MLTVHLLSSILFWNFHYVLGMEDLCCSYLYIYAHRRANLTSCTHLHLKETFMPSIYSWGAIPHHIFIWEAFLCHLGMGTFFEKPLMLLIHQYTYFKMHYLLFIHFARYFYATYSHISQNIFMPFFRCFVGFVHPIRLISALCQMNNMIKNWSGNEKV